jgi:hypothetical protein
MRWMGSVLSALFLGIATLLLLGVHSVHAAPSQQQPKQAHTHRKNAERNTNREVIVGTIEWEIQTSFLGLRRTELRSFRPV